MNKIVVIKQSATLEDHHDIFFQQISLNSNVFLQFKSNENLLDLPISQGIFRKHIRAKMTSHSTTFDNIISDALVQIKYPI